MMARLESIAHLVHGSKDLPGAGVTMANKTDQQQHTCSTNAQEQPCSVEQ
jgi:hypothetical protein